MEDEEPPPAYQEQTEQEAPPTQENKGLKDGPTSATETEAKPAKERRADEPAEDGEGVLSSPLKRMMFVGVILLLYYILSFWHPVYWMASAASYCKFTCNTYPDSAGGCYETTDPLCEDTCDAACDVCTDDNVCSELLDTMYETIYLNSGIDARLAAFTMIVLGFIFGAAGVIVGYFAVKKGHTLMSQIAAAILFIAGILSIVGAIIFLSTWHENIDFEEVLAAIQIMVFIEYLLPGIIVIILAIDIFTYAAIFNDAKKRMLAFTVPFAVFGFMGGILWAYVINWEPDAPANIGYDFPLYDSGGCIAAGYFLMSFMSIARILIFGEFVQIPIAQQVVVKFLVTIILCIGAFIVAVGYWAMIDAVFDCDYNILVGTQTCDSIYMLTYVNGDTVGPSMGALYDVPYEGQFKCYYVSYTFFILLITALNVYDMDIVTQFKAVQTAQQAANATNTDT